MSDHFSSSDDDLEEMITNGFRVEVASTKTKEFFEELTDDEYKQHFRLSRAKTKELAGRFETSKYFNYQEGPYEKLSSLKFITVFLWFAANAASFQNVADQFKISKSTLHKIVRKVTYFISNLSPEIIRWPSTEEQKGIEEDFRRKNLPGAVGIIAGTHIKINKPAEDPDSYLNTKHFYSIQAQIVCDNKCRIRDIFVGYPGSVPDSQVLRASPLGETLPEKCGNNFIIGDSDYPCLRHLLTPFRIEEQLTRNQANYNVVLSTNKYMIEHCLMLLKHRFRRLSHIKFHNIADIVHFIRACCVLHNLCEEEDFEVVEEEPELRNSIEVLAEDDPDGIIRRNEVMADLQFQI